ncbi:FUSC family protein [Solicola gregarius]|uniref:FUSC family protein n=1 Tax=Solicola gregarius TaxID=2908642 RepID=A0AA46YK32_9ACTN|nr:FUSC family protein [Solicola gregarius]UYM04184.1 FUSC family protein [Solicola gregarius]
MSAWMTRLTDRADDRQLVRPMAMSERWGILRGRAPMIVRLALGTSLAWLVATELIGHVQPFFAPVAAALTIAAGLGQRRSVVVELVVGVSVGILAGEVLITWMGRGAWQIAVVVALAVSVASLLGLKGMALMQSATSAILIAAVLPAAATGNPAVARFLDALVGGVIGLAMTAIVPTNPLRDLDREIQSVLGGLASILDQVAESMRLRDAGVAWTALQETRALQPTLEGLASTSASATEVSRISPLRWSQREHVRLYTSTVHDIDNAVRDARVLARRVTSMLRHGEDPPDGMDDAVAALADAVRIFGGDLQEYERFDEAKDKLVAAARSATEALSGSGTLNASAVVAQIRSLAADLLFASGWSAADVDSWLQLDD